jgi:hypothetical protein
MKNKSGPIFNLPKHCAHWLAGVLLLAAGAAHAELGGNFASVQAEVQRVNGTLHTISMPNYDVHEIQVNDHVIERQYVNHAGQVFGVSWKSKGAAALQPMLGAYFPKYQALGARRIDLHHAALTTPGLVVEVGSFLQTFMGRAYVPGQIPSGVAPSEIH